MDYRKRLMLAALLAVCGHSYGAYSSVAIKPTITGSGTARALARVAANDVAFVGNTVRTTGSLSVGGRAVTMPVAMRIAANAPRVIAAAAYLNPLLMVATTAALAYAYYKESGFEIVNGEWKKKAGDGGSVDMPYWEFEYTPASGGGVRQSSKYSSISSAASAYARLTSGTTPSGIEFTVTVKTLYANDAAQFHIASRYWVPPQVIDSQNTSPGYWQDDVSTDVVRYFSKGVYTAETPPQYEPVTQPEFEQAFADKPISPLIWPSMPPGFPIPIEEPVVNPSPDPVPVSKPLRVPQGDPVPIPDTVPQQWRTPAVDVIPSPTVSDPFRVDLQPVDVIKNTPDKIPETVDIPPTPEPDTQVKPKEEKDQGLCALFPEILACAKPELDTPEGPDIQKQNMDVTINPDSGWGGGGGSCPAARHIAGANVEFSFQPLCDGIAKFRPLILAFAWLSAAFILVGMRQGNDV